MKGEGKNEKVTRLLNENQSSTPNQGSPTQGPKTSLTPQAQSNSSVPQINNNNNNNITTPPLKPQTDTDAPYLSPLSLQQQGSRKMSELRRASSLLVNKTVTETSSSPQQQISEPLPHNQSSQNPLHPSPLSPPNFLKSNTFITNSYFPSNEEISLEPPPTKPPSFYSIPFSQPEFTNNYNKPPLQNLNKPTSDSYPPQLLLSSGPNSPSITGSSTSLPSSPSVSLPLPPVLPPLPLLNGSSIPQEKPVPTSLQAKQPSSLPTSTLLSPHLQALKPTSLVSSTLSLSSQNNPPPLTQSVKTASALPSPTPQSSAPVAPVRIIKSRSLLKIGNILSGSSTQQLSSEKNNIIPNIIPPLPPSGDAIATPVFSSPLTSTKVAEISSPPLPSPNTPIPSPVIEKIDKVSETHQNIPTSVVPALVHHSSAITYEEDNGVDFFDSGDSPKKNTTDLQGSPSFPPPLPPLPSHYIAETSITTALPTETNISPFTTNLSTQPTALSTETDISPFTTNLSTQPPLLPISTVKYEEEDNGIDFFGGGDDENGEVSLENKNNVVISSDKYEMEIQQQSSSGQFLSSDDDGADFFDNASPIVPLSSSSECVKNTNVSALSEIENNKNNVIFPPPQPFYNPVENTYLLSKQTYEEGVFMNPFYEQKETWDTKQGEKTFDIEGETCDKKQGEKTFDIEGETYDKNQGEKTFDIEGGNGSGKDIDPKNNNNNNGNINNKSNSSNVYFSNVEEEDDADFFNHLDSGFVSSQNEDTSDQKVMESKISSSSEIQAQLPFSETQTQQSSIKTTEIPFVSEKSEIYSSLTTETEIQLPSLETQPSSETQTQFSSSETQTQQSSTETTEMELRPTELEPPYSVDLVVVSSSTGISSSPNVIPSDVIIGEPPIQDPASVQVEADNGVKGTVTSMEDEGDGSDFFD
jgi:hypothetical protein